MTRGTVVVLNPVTGERRELPPESVWTWLASRPTGDAAPDLVAGKPGEASTTSPGRVAE